MGIARRAGRHQQRAAAGQARGGQSQVPPQGAIWPSLPPAAAISSTRRRPAFASAGCRPAHGQRTERLRSMLSDIGLALAGRAGACMAQALGVGVSRSTVLRLVDELPERQLPTPRVVDVDEYATRKGRHYGTVLVDVETRRPVDLLPDREAVLRGPRRTHRQETTGRTVRRDPAATGQEDGRHRPSAGPGQHQTQGAGHPASCGTMRGMRTPRQGGSPPRRQARRPWQTGRPAAVGRSHGRATSQGPCGLRQLPCGHPRQKTCPSTHGVITGERRAVKVACVVRAGGRGKRTCSAGTSPTAHQYPLAQLTEAAERSVSQHRRCLSVLVPTVPQTKAEPAPAAESATSPWTTSSRFAAPTTARHATIHALIKAGHSRRSIQRQLGMTYRTVQRFADAARPENLFTRQWQNRTSALDEYKPYLDDRWREGCTNARKLWEGIVPSATRGATARPRIRASKADITTAGGGLATRAPLGCRMDPAPPRGPHGVRTAPAQERLHQLSRDRSTHPLRSVRRDHADRAPGRTTAGLA